MINFFFSGTNSIPEGVLREGMERIEQKKTTEGLMTAFDEGLADVIEEYIRDACEGAERVDLDVRVETGDFRKRS